MTPAAPDLSVERGGMAPPNSAADRVAAMNDEYAVVLVGGSVAVLRERTDAEGRPELVLMTPSALETWTKPETILYQGRRVPVARRWLASASRRQYEGITFAPREERPGYYNLWRGFTVEPDPDAGSCQRLLDHVLENVCQGNHAHFDWVMGWFAQMVQDPMRKPGVALVLRGQQGTGKSILGTSVGSLLGPHYQMAADARYVTGRFNSHLANCLMLQLDEATWGGDHQAAGKLKDLVTSEHHLIEYKGKEPVAVRNYVRLFITGNSHWLVPAGREERRFATFDVGDAARQDRRYFGAIAAELAGGVQGPGSNGGRQALLAYLLDFDLSEIDFGELPDTEALRDQKLASLTSEEEWWQDVLTTGRLAGDRDGAGLAPCSAIIDDYVRHASRAGARRRSAETALGRFLRRVVPAGGTLSRKRHPLPTGERVPHYEFPTLEACRAAWDEQMKQRTAWPEPHTWDRDISSSPPGSDSLFGGRG